MSLLILTQPKIGRTAINTDRITYFYAVETHTIIQFGDSYIIVQEDMDYIESSMKGNY